MRRMLLSSCAVGWRLRVSSEQPRDTKTTTTGILQVAVSLIIVSGFVASLNAQDHRGKFESRRIQFVPGRALEAEISPDVPLRVELPGAGTLPVKLPEGMTAAEYATRHADVVAMVQVLDVFSKLSRDRDWINSTVQGTITALLKNASNVPLTDGAAISFEATGGELQTENGTAVASFEHVRPMQPGQRYLVFLRQVGAQLVIQPLDAYEISGNSVRDLYTGPGSFAVLGKTNQVTAIVNEVRQRAALSTIK